MAVCSWSFSRDHLRVRSPLRDVTRPHQPTFFHSEHPTATAAMSSVKGGYDEVEFLYSKPPYVFWILSDIHPETGLAVNRSFAPSAEWNSPG